MLTPRSQRHSTGGSPVLIPRFETLLCDTHEAQTLHYQTRYKVFCEQTGFEDPENFPDGAERDEYDGAAVQFVMWDRMQQRMMGAMRLIDAKRTPLPCENICRGSLFELDAVRERTVEFSRLAILRDHQRVERRGDTCDQSPSPIDMAESEPVYMAEEKNEALLRLLWASFEWGEKNDVDYCYFIVTAPLARMLKRFGIPLTILGTEVKHRGVRHPYRYNIHEAKKGMIATLPKFARLMQRSEAYIRYSEFRSQLCTTVEPNACHPLPVSVVQPEMRAA